MGVDTLTKRGGGEEHPDQERAPFVHVLIQDMGGGATERQKPPTTRKSRSNGATREWHSRRGHREGSLPPLGGRGVPEDQTRRIVAQIVHQPPGQSPPSGLAPAPHRQQY